MGKQQKGFTLVELIVVISVISLLFLTAMVAYRGVRTAARDEGIASDANRILAHHSLLDTLRAGDTSSFVNTGGAHSFCPMCLATGVPATFAHDSDCTAVVAVEIVWDYLRTNSNGETAWAVAGLQ